MWAHGVAEVDLDHASDGDPPDCLRPFGPGRSAAGGVPNRKVIVLLAHDSSGKDLTVGSLPEIIDAHLAAGDTFGTLI